ncbi:hypothetical protein Tco_0937506 [Tanacetum coccineum]|uniref:Uncharacterized protein n=1 Tax=Tanacetum coccineum TaxID=301880 RepID=A0ABQ5DEG8_9ASTR
MKTKRTLAGANLNQRTLAGRCVVAVGCGDGDVGGCSGGDAAAAAAMVAIGVAVDDGSGGVIVVRGMVMVAAG